MEHKPLSDLSHVADVLPEPSARLTRRERLERWVEALERQPERRLSTLHEIEHTSCNERRASRVELPAFGSFREPCASSGWSRERQTRGRNGLLRTLR